MYAPNATRYEALSLSGFSSAGRLCGCAALRLTPLGDAALPLGLVRPGAGGAHVVVDEAGGAGLHVGHALHAVDELVAGGGVVVAEVAVGPRALLGALGLLWGQRESNEKSARSAVTDIEMTSNTTIDRNGRHRNDHINVLGSKSTNRRYRRRFDIDSMSYFLLGT